jgi:hypothetical protein
MLFVGHKRRILWAQQQRNMVMMWQWQATSAKKDKIGGRALVLDENDEAVVKNGGVTHDERRARHFCDTCERAPPTSEHPIQAILSSISIIFSKNLNNFNEKHIAAFQ